MLGECHVSDKDKFIDAFTKIENALKNNEPLPYDNETMLIICKEIKYLIYKMPDFTNRMVGFTDLMQCDLSQIKFNKPID
jgi:hypothetical protein